ncbi:MAG: hypothetical protein V3V34_11745 [Kiloniellales bacterium]
MLSTLILISCWPSAADLGAAIEKMSWAPLTQRAARARKLATRILIEARRHKLDPIALAAVGSVESDYRPAARGPGAKPRGFGYRIYEFGTFQLIPASSPVRAAARRLSRLCKPATGPAVIPTATKPSCPRDIWQARKGRAGSFRRGELEDYTIGTWIAALEIKMHLVACQARHKRGHGWRHAWYHKHYAKRHGLTAREVRHLDRWAHYNSGPTTRTLLRYTQKLVARYAKLKRLACRRGRSI